MKFIRNCLLCAAVLFTAALNAQVAKPAAGKVAGVTSHWPVVIVPQSESLVAPNAKFAVKKVADIVVYGNGLSISGKFGDNIHGTGFQQEILASSHGYQYTAFYDEDRRVCVARRNLANDKIEVVRVPGYRFTGGKGGNDGHNTISIGICEADGTLHVSFDHHNDTLRYLRTKPGVVTEPSKVKWNDKIFMPMNNRIDGRTVVRLCYPRFITAPRGGLQFAYRIGGSGNGDGFIADYDPVKGEITNPRKIDTRMGVYRDFKDSSERRSLYRNGFDYDKNGILHASGAWREKSGGTNHGIVYVYSPDGGTTWYNSKDVKVGSPDKPVSVNSPGLNIAEVGRDKTLMNQQTQGIDSRNRPHIVVWHRNDRSTFVPGKWWDLPGSSYFHYWRKANGQWVRGEVPSPVGTRPKLFFDKNDNAFIVYTVKNLKDKRDKGFHFDNGTLVIAGASASKLWRDWQVIYQENGRSFLGEPLVDRSRLDNDGIVSVYMQDTPSASLAPAPIRVLEYVISPKK